jgi:hypothetical protein
MNNLSTKKKKTATHIAAMALAAISLTAAPLASTLPAFAKETKPVYYTETTYTESSFDNLSYVTINDSDYDEYTIFYPGQYITNTYDHSVNLYFIDDSAYVMVTLPAQTEYQLQYIESASGISVGVADYWIYYGTDGSNFIFVTDL